MIDGIRVLAIVPARGGSRGLPGKNGRLLLNRPLLAWPISAARAAHCVDRVVVSTDDPRLADQARDAGAEVPFMRPANLAGDRTPSAAVVIHALDELAAVGEHFGYFVLLEPTSPLTEGADVDAALLRLHGSRDRADAIVGVVRTEAEHPAFAVTMSATGTISPLSGGGFDELPRRQDLPDAYRLEGSLYASDVAAFRAAGAFCHGRTMGYAVPRYKSLEVDDLMDFVCIEAVAARLDELRADALGAQGETP
jgi:N-acylneuraminate cytidylyltransferase/CMP-N,N'-diacetyllegionaminic acid synthase